MPMPRRAANRQEILDAYSDMSSADQDSLIAELSQIHRILKRERSRNFADPKDNAALLLAMPEGHEQ